MKKALKIIPILIIMSMLFSACSENFRKDKVIEEDTYEERYDVIDKGPVKGGSVRLFTTPIDTLNPIITNNIYVQEFLGLVFEGLYKLDNTQSPVPVLAESSSLSADGLVLTIKLKDNIKWHDKMPFKADDVVFTINTLLDSKNNSVYIKNVQNIASVSAGNNNTVIIRLKQPYSFILEDLTFPILPYHYFLNEKINVKNSKRNLSPIGTGPYTFVSYNSEQGIKLKLNEEWWNSGNDTINSLSLPYISTIEVKIFKNSNEANAAFQARDVDVIPADYSEFRKYIGRTDITMKRYPGKNYEFLSLNINKGPLTDKRVRNAINSLIDKKQLVDTVASGIAVSAEIPVIPNSWVYQLVNLEQNVDIKKIKELMTQSGYVYDADKNKYLNKKTKKALTLKLIVNNDNSLRFNTANEIAKQLGKKGIVVQVEKIAWDEVQKRIKLGTYDMALLGYKISNIPDLSFAYSTEQIKTGLNVAGYSNALVDGYLQQILTQNNAEVRSNTYKNLLNAVLDDRPYIGLYFLNESMMYSKNIRGTINPYVWNKYDDISQWYIP
jgi:peptide/nickel transport system substrate-binding protein